MKELENEVGDIIKSFNKETQEKATKIAKEVAKDGTNNLKKTSPKKTGGYAKGWTTKKSKTGYLIYNKDKPWLTHLLEHGHIVANNKKGKSRVDGIEHIKPVEDYAIKEFIRRVEEEI